MKKDKVHINGVVITVYSLNTVVVGSGAAGLNAADRLYTNGQEDIAIVTEGINMGTSRNTGSDKQTYYKLTLAGETSDSVLEMAKNLYDGGCMDGDMALIEAAMSAQCFYRLADIGVPFPHNRYGEYVGYKTDHDPRQRATSAGPLTSRFMTEKLEAQVRKKGIRVFDGYYAIGILTDSSGKKAVGLIALNLNGINNVDTRYVAFNCTNIVYATGGPAGIYEASVYPECHTGSSGIAFEAGVGGRNLTESQYGIASTKFRWNLSGTYQQVLPRYISTDMDGGDEREFLESYFSDPGKMLRAIFLKGYQWPFDSRKIVDNGSSLIDILVYYETKIKNRRVFLDYMKNPEWASKDGELDFSIIEGECFEYLKNSGALFGRPIDRLLHMNNPAVKLYMDNGIDLTREYLEIDVCAQHNNGGLMSNIWWESNITHFFPVGEVSGTHGVYRPGGSALNSGQVGSTRAAMFIASRYTDSPPSLEEWLNETVSQIDAKIFLGHRFLESKATCSNVLEIRKRIGNRMTRAGAHIRDVNDIERALREAEEDFCKLDEETRISSEYELAIAFSNRDLLITQIVYLSAIRDYISMGGKSRGSYIIRDKQGILAHEALGDDFRFSLDDGSLMDKIQHVYYKNGKCIFNWRDVNSIPVGEHWFENIWNKYMADEIIK